MTACSNCSLKFCKFEWRWRETLTEKLIFFRNNIWSILHSDNLHIIENLKYEMVTDSQLTLCNWQLKPSNDLNSKVDFKGFNWICRCFEPFSNSKDLWFMANLKNNLQEIHLDTRNLRTPWDWPMMRICYLSHLIGEQSFTSFIWPIHLRLLAEPMAQILFLDHFRVARVAERYPERTRLDC